MTKKKQSLTRWFILMGIFALQMGCATTQTGLKEAVNTPNTAKANKKSVKVHKNPPAKPLATKSKSAEKSQSTSLTGEVFYYLLSAEIAAQRGNIALSSALYTKAAKVTRDPRVAQQATRVAFYARDDKRALLSAKLWHELEPKNLEARQVLAALLVRTGNMESAVEHFEYVLSNGKHTERQRFMLITSLLSKEKDKNAALAVMQKLVAKRKNNPHALYAYSRLAFLVGDLHDALATVKKVIKFQPEWTEAHILQSNIFVRQGNKAKAIDTLRETVDAQPDNIELRMFYARNLVDAKQFAEAINQFSELSNDGKLQNEARYALGLLNLQMNKPKDAANYFIQLLENKKRAVEAQYYLAQSYELQNELGKAIQAYAEVRNNQYSFDAGLRTALILAKQGKIADARLRLQNMSADSLEKELRVYLTEGEILNTAKQYEDALDLYNEALTQITDNERLLYARALTAEKLGMLDLAIKDLESIVKREPSNAQALNALGYTLVDKTQQLTRGLGLIKKALELEPNDAAIQDSLGWAYYRLGKYDESLKYLRRAFGQLKDAEIAAHLGEVLWVSGKQEAAQKIWGSALQKAPNDDILLGVMQKFTE